MGQPASSRRNRAGSAGPTRHVALLRGINLGSRNRVRMPELRALLKRLGYQDVATHLQSGNVVLTSAKSAKQIAGELEEQIAAELGVRSPVVVRNREELAEVVEGNPFGEAAKEPKLLQVTFLSAKPKPAVVRELEGFDFAPEQVVFGAREVYAWHPGGVQNSKLARALTDKRLGVTATARNWNTVTRLLELAGA